MHKFLYILPLLPLLTGCVGSRAANPPSVPSTPASVTTSPTAPNPRHTDILRYSTELSLTPDQKAKIEAAVTAARRQSRTILSDPKLKPEDKTAKLVALQQQERDALNAVLTPDQQKKLLELKAQDRTRRQTGQVLAALGSAVKLTGDQQTKLQTILADSATKAGAIRETKDLDARARYTRLHDLQKDTDSKINTVLTPDQQKAWQDFQRKQAISRQSGAMLSSLTSLLTLTPDQQKNIKPLLDESAAKAEALRTDDKLQPSDRNTRLHTLQQDTEKDLSKFLTPDQQEKLTALSTPPASPK